MRRSKVYLSQGAICFLICRFLAYITSTLYVGSFRLQSSRPFSNRNVNSMTLDMSDNFHMTLKRPIKPDVLQLDAIICKDPAILVVAGPGSGKTRVMASRLAFLLNSRSCEASECLVISFTSSAATNLLDKTKEMCSQFGSEALTVGVFCDTFHGFCNTVIQENVGLLMDDKGFCIASDEDQMKIMSEIMDCNGMTSTRAEVKNILIRIRYWKELGLGYLGVRKNSLHTEEEKMAYKLYPLYQSKLKMMSALDFGDLLLSTLRLFRQNPKVLDRYRSRFKHILVDEFQDVSPAQYDILRMLVMGSTTGRADIAGGGPGGLSAEEGVADLILRQKSEMKQNNRIVNLFCAGDDDQSIYAYRGAKVELMQRFRFDFPGSRVLKFGISYRLPDIINKATQSFISTSSGRILKPLVSSSLEYEEAEGDSSITPISESNSSLSDDGTKNDLQNNSLPALNMPISRASIEVRGMQDEKDEVKWITSYLKSRADTYMQSNARGAGEPEDYSIVVLTRHDSKSFEATLRSEGIAFSSRNFGFWNQQKEYSAPLNLLRLLASPEDDEAFPSALDNDIILSSIPKAELLEHFIPELRATADLKSSSLLNALRELVLTPKSNFYKNKAFNDFLQHYDRWSAKLENFKKGERGENIVREVLKSAFEHRWDSIHVALCRLSNSAAGYDSLQHFVSAVRLEGVFVEEPGLRKKDPDSHQGAAHNSTSSSGPRRPKLTIWVMAMHAAKGLEFDEVILPFWSKGTSMDLEDERKIAFMSLTRAKRRVMISYSKTKWTSGIQQVTAGASLGIQQVTTGASLFVEKLLHIPGLRITHEEFEPRKSAFKPYSSQQQQQHQQQIAYNKALTSYSNSNRDTNGILDSSDRSRQGRSSTADDSGIQLSKYNLPRAPPNSRDIGTASSVSSNPLTRRERQAQQSTNGLREEESVDGVHPLLKSNLKILVTSMKSNSEVHQLPRIVTTSAVDAIVVDNVAQAVAKKSRKKGDVSLAAFPSASKVTVEKITELLNDETHTQLALRFYFRDVIKYQLNIEKGAIPVKDGDKPKALSSCSAKELAEYIRISLIKKNGT